MLYTIESDIKDIPYVALVSAFHQYLHIRLSSQVSFNVILIHVPDVFVIADIFEHLWSSIKRLLVISHIILFL